VPLPAGAIAQREGKLCSRSHSYACCYVLLGAIILTPLNRAALFDRKLRIKRSIKVPAISNKIADIPPDEYSWRKYGQKPIKGSPHPRYDMN